MEESTYSYPPPICIMAALAGSIIMVISVRKKK